MPTNGIAFEISKGLIRKKLAAQAQLAREKLKYAKTADLIAANRAAIDAAQTIEAHTRGLLRRMTINGGLQHCIGKEVSRFEQGKDDFIEHIDDMCIHYDGGRVAANEALEAEINARGLRKSTRQTSLDRKTIRAILNGEKVKASTLAKIVMGLREE